MRCQSRLGSGASAKPPRASMFQFSPVRTASWSLGSTAFGRPQRPGDEHPKLQPNGCVNRAARVSRPRFGRRNRLPSLLRPLVPEKPSQHPSGIWYWCSSCGGSCRDSMTDPSLLTGRPVRLSSLERAAEIVGLVQDILKTLRRMCAPPRQLCSFQPLEIRMLLPQPRFPADWRVCRGQRGC